MFSCLFTFSAVCLYFLFTAKIQIFDRIFDKNRRKLILGLIETFFSDFETLWGAKPMIFPLRVVFWSVSLWFRSWQVWRRLATRALLLLELLLLLWWSQNMSTRFLLLSPFRKHRFSFRAKATFDETFRLVSIGPFAAAAASVFLKFACLNISISRLKPELATLQGGKAKSTSSE